MPEHAARPDPDPGSAIGSALRLLQVGLPGGLALLAAPLSSDRVRVADAHPDTTLVGTELGVPPGLLGPAPVALRTGAIRLSLAWTIACGRRPSAMASAPVPHHRLHVVAATCEGGEIALSRLTDTALIIGCLMGAGQSNQLERDTFRRARALVRRLPAPIAFVDALGSEIIVNEEGRQLLGLTDEAAPPAAVAAALSRLLQGQEEGTDGTRLAADPTADLAFEIQVDERILKVASRWIEGEALSGRFWMFSDVTQERSLQRQLAELARRDSLTGLLNRRSFDDHLTSEVERARRHGSPLSLLALDLDRFKTINDTFGHPAGDEVLQKASRLATQALRANDLSARIGGEEFAILLPGTPLSGAMEVAERIRSAIDRATFLHEGTPLPVTCSIGVADFDARIDTPASLLNRADVALYAAKRLGRNRTEHHVAAPPV